VNILDLVTEPNLLGDHFAGPTWDRWRAVLKAAYAQPLTPDELTLFHEVAGDRTPPTAPIHELVAIVGRGGGKTAVAASLATHAAVNYDRTGTLAGERGTVAIIANTKDQAAIAHNYVAGFFEKPAFARLLASQQSGDSILLSNGAEIITVANSFRAPRGRRIIAAVYDEVAFWRSDESATPDHEVDAAVTPGLVRHPGSLKILISSAYRKAGLLYERHVAAFGKDDPRTLVVLGTSLQFNETLDADTIAAEIAKDEARASAEYLSLWRDDISSFVDRDLVDELTDDVLVRPYDPSVRSYRAFADEAGGGINGDSSTLAIAHLAADGRVIVDGVWIWKPPFSESAVIAAKAAILTEYKLYSIVGDGWAGQLIPNLFLVNGKNYEQTPDPKTAHYLSFLAILNARGVRLTSDPTVRSELLALERKTRWGGGESIDHPQIAGAHDDAINAVAGAVVLAAGVKGLFVPAEVVAASTQLDPAAYLRRAKNLPPELTPEWRTMTPQQKMQAKWGREAVFGSAEANTAATRNCRLTPSLRLLELSAQPANWRRS
jgi:hypothetical protein